LAVSPPLLLSSACAPPKLLLARLDEAKSCLIWTRIGMTMSGHSALCAEWRDAHGFL
jgi:hypothetical protein